MTDYRHAATISRLLASDGAVAVLSTVGEDGSPTSVLGAALSLSENGTLLYCEPLESSPSAHDLTRSLWFDRSVSFAVQAGGERIRGRGVPVQAHITGEVFQEHYRAVRAADPEADLAAVWEIRIDQLEDASVAALRRSEEERRPFFQHLDRLVPATAPA